MFLLVTWNRVVDYAVRNVTPLGVCVCVCVCLCFSFPDVLPCDGGEEGRTVIPVGDPAWSLLGADPIRARTPGLGWIAAIHCRHSLCVRYNRSMFLAPRSDVTVKIASLKQTSSCPVRAVFAWSDDKQRYCGNLKHDYHHYVGNLPYCHFSTNEANSNHCGEASWLVMCWVNANHHSTTCG
jgi:hypothetical protein